MEKNNDRPDLRVVKTRKAIRNAFAELLTEKDIEAITVKDIAERAVINRKTFYNYYGGIYQIIDEIENEIVNAFDVAMKEIDSEKGIKNPYLIFMKLTAVINSDLDFYGALLKTKGNASLVSKITDLVKTKARETFKSQFETDETTLFVITDYAISGMLSVYQNWFNSDRAYSIKKVSEVVGKMFSDGITGVINGNPY